MTFHLYLISTNQVRDCIFRSSCIFFFLFFFSHVLKEQCLNNNVFPCCLQTTYENFRYRYDLRANPYNKGLLLNFREILCGSIPPSKNNFRAKAPREAALPGRPLACGLASPRMGKAADDIEMGRKAVWGDIGAVLDQREGQFSDGNGLNNKSGGFGETSPEIRSAVDEGGMRSSSWGRKGGNWERSPEILALASRMAEANRTAGTGSSMPQTEPRL